MEGYDLDAMHGSGGGGSRNDWEPWEDEAIRNFVES